MDRQLDFLAKIKSGSFAVLMYDVMSRGHSMVWVRTRQKGPPFVDVLALVLATWQQVVLDDTKATYGISAVSGSSLLWVPSESSQP